MDTLWVLMAVSYIDLSGRARGPDVSKSSI